MFKELASIIENTKPIDYIPELRINKKSSKSEADKSKDFGTVRIGTQSWAVANLNVTTFRNGDTIPEARTYKEWETAGESRKPAWCYYNNDPVNGPRYGRLYNWYAINDPIYCIGKGEPAYSRHMGDRDAR